MFVCNTCKYPSEHEYCSNPGCEANPAVSEEQKAKWRAAHEKAQAEEAERQRIIRIRRRAMGY